jgi:hypothetical protein
MADIAYESATSFLSRNRLSVIWYFALFAFCVQLWTEWHTEDVAWRYDPGHLMFKLATVLIFLISARRIWAKLFNSDAKLAAGTVASGLASAIMIAFGGFSWSTFPTPLCGVSAGCFFLTRGPYPTDVVYEIWHGDSYWAPTLQRYFVDGELNYSEDGKYTENPGLRLSKNEAVLVLSRGGMNVDAVCLENVTLLSPFVSWTDPDVAEKMRRNSERIERLLSRNLGQEKVCDLESASALGKDDKHHG